MPAVVKKVTLKTRRIMTMKSLPGYSGFDFSSIFAGIIFLILDSYETYISGFSCLHINFRFILSVFLQGEESHNGIPDRDRTGQG